MKKETKEFLLITAIVIIAFIAIEIAGNSYIKYRDNNLPRYSFEVIDKWQDIEGGFLSGGSTAYHLKVKVAQIEDAGFFVIEDQFKNVQTIKVNYSKYQNYNVGDKFTGTDPNFKHYE